jgi:hypothetical protein
MILAISAPRARIRTSQEASTFQKEECEMFDLQDFIDRCQRLVRAGAREAGPGSHAQRGRSND